MEKANEVTDIVVPERLFLKNSMTGLISCVMTEIDLSLTTTYKDAKNTSTNSNRGSTDI